MDKSSPTGGSGRTIITPVRCPKCNDVRLTSDTTPRIVACEKCGTGLNLDQAFFDRARIAAAEATAKRREAERKEGLKQLIGIFAVLFALILGPPLLSILFGPGITNRGCSLSVDVVVFGHCWFGSFGLSIAATVVVTAVLFVPKLLLNKLKDSFRK